MIVCSFIFCLFSCDENANIFQNTSTITIEHQDSIETIEVTNDKFVYVDPKAKSGYLFLGYFDAPEGGEKYIDFNGKSTAKWKKGFPSKLYPQWKSIYDVGGKSGLLFDDEPKSLGLVWGYFNLSDEIKRAVEENPGKKMEIIVHWKAKYSSNHDEPMSIKARETDYNGELLGKQTGLVLQSEYNAYSATFEFEASLVRNGKIYIEIDNSASSYWVCGYVKDLYIEVNFVE